MSGTELIALFTGILLILAAGRLIPTKYWLWGIPLTGIGAFLISRVP